MAESHVGNGCRQKHLHAVRRRKLDARTATSTPPSREGTKRTRRTIWDSPTIEAIAGTDDLHVAPFRADGITYGTPTAAVGSGDLVSIEYWRGQVRLGSNSALRTFTLRREPLSTHWLLEHISG
jgi:hypothetical protein